MGIRKNYKVMERLNQMVDNAIDGKPVESGFDETKMSALETKLSDYIAASCMAKEQLMEEQEKIHRLVSDISHQTKTPLSNILLYTQLLGEGNLTGKDRECVDFLMEQADKLNFLIASLVKTSRLETGMVTLVPKVHAIEEVLAEVRNQIKAKAEEKNIMLTWDTSESYGVFDPKWTGEALYNILDNAVKYTKAGGSVHISVVEYQLFCCIDITDTGIGMDEGETAKAFLRFYRSEEVREKEGIGIGLYLAREMISAQHGYIRIRSKKGKGSTFSVYLPKERG